MPNVEVSGLRGFLRRSARLPGWGAGQEKSWVFHLSSLAPCFPAGISFGDSSPLRCADETGDQNAQDGAVLDVPREKREREAGDRKPEMGGNAVLTVTTEGVAESCDCEQRKSPSPVPLCNFLRGAMHSSPPTL